jgi:hypothetical protein
MSPPSHVAARPALRSFRTALCAAALWTAPALGDDLTQAADQHFGRGLTAARAGKMTLAASEFERAYEAAPHYSVLYNLGLVYAALGRNADAVRVLRRYLVDGGENVSPTRRAEVQAIVQDRSSGLGRTTLRILPDDAAVTLDARRLERAELLSPVELDPGPHLLVVEREGYPTIVRRFEIAPGAEVEIDAPLEKAAEATPSEKSVAVFVDCQVPQSTLLVDGALTKVPSRDVPLVMTKGRHEVRFSRPGYVDDVQSITASHGQRVSCRLKAQAPLPSVVAGALEVEAPSDSRVLVNGARFEGAPLPVGLHRVTVLRDGHLEWQRDVLVKPGATSRVEARLQPTPEQQRLERAATARRSWALATGLAGLGLLTTGVVVYVLNGERYEEWQADSAAFSKSEDASAAQLKRKSVTLQQRAADIQQLDDVAFTVGGLGIAAMGVGAALYLSTPSAVVDNAGLRAKLGPPGLELSGTW